MARIQAHITDAIKVNKIRKVTKSRKYPNDSRTVIDLALERAKQIEDYGEVPLIPAKLALAGSVV